jgi:phosphate transport system substrate-binding protein
VKRTSFRKVAGPTATALALGLSLTACGAANEQGSDASNASGTSLSGTVNGAGSSAQEAAQGAWAAGFQSANPDVTVNYDPVGSGGGVEQFLAGGVQFAGSDKYLTPDEVAQSKKACHGQTAFEVPDYISPIALVYNVDGVNDLRLSPETAAKIFAGTITRWDDPAIKAENPGAKLPAQHIAPVHRSDDSGTTNNFTDSLHQTAPSVWTWDAAETWPVKSGEGAQGTSGVISAVTNGAGTIGYADASQAGKLSVAKVKVGSSYVGPTADAAAKVADVSKPESGRADDDLALNIDRTTTEAGAYPIVLVSYLIGCPAYGEKSTAGLVKGYLSYVVSNEGQQAAQKVAGSAPLPDRLSRQATDIVSTISAAS